MTKIEIIDETVEYYTTHPRAIEPTTGKCSYKNKNGDFCAHSRCLTDKARNIILEDQRNHGGCYGIIKDYGDEIHQEKYQGHDSGFWGEIQKLHDGKVNWTINENGKNELTQEGKETVRALKKQYSEN